MAGQGYRHWLVGRGKERGPGPDRPRLGEPPTGGTAEREQGQSDPGSKSGNPRHGGLLLTGC